MWLTGSSRAIARGYPPAVGASNEECLARALPHPKLVDQHSQPGGAVLVVADALRKHVDHLGVDERHPRRLVDGLPVDPLPPSAGGVGVRRLLGQASLDLPVDVRVAELGDIRVPRVIGEERRAGEDGVEEAGWRGIVGDPFGRSDLRPGARVAYYLEVAEAAPGLHRRAIAQRPEELHRVRAQTAQVRPGPDGDLHAARARAGDEGTRPGEIRRRPAS